MGETWESVVNGHSNSDDTWFREIIALDDSLFIMGSSSSGQARAYRYINGNIEKLAIQTFPNMQGSYPQKIIRFRDGVLYIGSNTPFTMRSPSPLIFLNDFGSGVVIVEEFREKNVRDIVVRDGVCYVLTASKSDSALQGRIHSSSDLEKWTRLAEFSVSAMPYSLEILEGAAYVALGYSPESVDAEVGSIYKLELDNSPSTDSTKLPAWDIDKDGTISMSDLALVGQHLGEISTTPLEPNPDVNGDGKVDILDIVLVGKHFGEIYSLALPSEEI